MTTMEKHFVTFLSPGTFVSEQSTREIDSWDVEKAMEMANEIVERYNARPYAFYFTTKTRTDEDFDSKRTATSCTYHLGGEILTIEDVEKEGGKDNSIMLSNMRGGIPKVVRNRNSWEHHAPFKDGDVLLDYTPPPREEAKEG